MICEDCFCGVIRQFRGQMGGFDKKATCLLDNAIVEDLIECSRYRSKEETEKTSANAVREEVKEQGKPVNEEDPHWKYSGL